MLGARSYFPLMSPAKNTLVYSNARAYPLVPLCRLTWPAQVPSMTTPIVNGVNPLQTTLLELGIVSGRVALLLRSAEIQPVFGRFSMNGISHSPLLACSCYWVVLSQALGQVQSASHARTHGSKE